MIFNKTIEDYLRAIYRIRERDGEVGNLALARELGVTPAAASEMARRLAEADLVRVERYKGVALTTAGERAAVAITRRHRLWEVFLIQTLGFEWDEVHALADELEHVGDEKLMERLDSFLGSPRRDPHGDPIPGPREPMPQSDGRSIAVTSAGSGGTVERVSDEHPELLRYAASLGLRPGAQVDVLEQLGFDGSVRIMTEGRETVISSTLARSVFLASEGATTAGRPATKKRTQGTGRRTS